jgi:hypothetical protein
MRSKLYIMAFHKLLLLLIGAVQPKVDLSEFDFKLNEHTEIISPVSFFQYVHDNNTSMTPFLQRF